MFRTWCVLVVGIALCAAYGNKRSEIAPAPFVMGSRYGRSLPRVIAPRNDRFFMGSRYGKRAEAQRPLDPVVGHSYLARDELKEPLDCEYTGLRMLFRCTGAAPAVDGVKYDDRKSGETRPSDIDED